MTRPESRVVEVEKKLRRLSLVVALSVMSNVAMVLMAMAPASSGQDGHLAVQSLTVVDAAGTPRVLLGAPLPDPGDGERIADSVGLAINDENGVERFAVGLMSNGLMGMGFDARPGVGDADNRERLYLGVTADGRGFITVKDNKTRVRTHLGTIDEQGNNALMFVDWSDENPKYVGFGLEQLQELHGDPSQDGADLKPDE